MVAVVGGLLMLLIGEVSRRSYVKKRDEGTLPSMYEVRRIGLLNLYWGFLPLGAITLLAGVIQLLST